MGNIDPRGSMNAQMKSAIHLIYEPLLFIDSKQQLQPIIADSWQISRDKKIITFNLGKGHFFSDGTQITSQDVRNSFLHLCHPKSKSASDLKGLVGCQEKGIEPKIKVLEPFKIQMEISVHPTVFLFQIASSRIVIFKIENKLLLGSGPYIITDKTDDYLVLRKNVNHAKISRIKNQGLIFRYISERDFIVLLEEIKPDGTLMYRVSATTKIKHPDYNVIRDQPNITQTLVLNNQQFPFNNVILRRALAAEIYNEQSIEQCDFGVRKSYGLIPKGIGGSIAHVAPKQIPAISSKAVFKSIPQLHRKAADIIVHQHLGRKNNCIQERIQTAGKKFNLNIQFRYHDSYETLWPLYLSHDLHGFVELFVFSNREADSILQYFLSSSAENFANVNYPSLDKKIQAALESKAMTLRFAGYREVNRHLQENAVVVPLYYVGHSNFIQKCVRGFPNDFYIDPFQHLTQLYREKGCFLSPSAKY